MKTVTIAYLNDEKKKVSVRVMDLRYDPLTATGDFWAVLDIAEYKEFELQIPDDSIVYVKKWESQVLLSYSYRTSQQPVGQQQGQPQG